MAVDAIRMIVDEDRSLDGDISSIYRAGNGTTCSEYQDCETNNQAAHSSRFFHWFRRDGSTGT